MPFAEKKIIGEVWARNKQKWEKQSKNQFGTESETNNQAKHHKKVVSRLREVFINLRMRHKTPVRSKPHTKRLGVLLNNTNKIYSVKKVMIWSKTRKVEWTLENIRVEKIISAPVWAANVFLGGLISTRC